LVFFHTNGFRAWASRDETVRRFLEKSDALRIQMTEQALAPFIPDPGRCGTGGGADARAFVRKIPRVVPSRTGPEKRASRRLK